jgi:hypothetical protein
MSRGETNRKDNSDCRVLQFRLREVRDDGRRKRDACDIEPLLDLSRYENWREYPEDYKARMVENMAAIVLLFALVAIAAFDFIGLEQIQHCASAGSCGP